MIFFSLQTYELCIKPMGGCWKNSKNNIIFIIYVEIVDLS